MKKIKFFIYTFLLFLSIMVIGGCTPAEIKFTEEVAEESLEEDLKGR